MVMRPGAAFGIVMRSTLLVSSRSCRCVCVRASVHVRHGGRAADGRRLEERGRENMDVQGQIDIDNGAERGEGKERQGGIGRYMDRSMEIGM